METEGKRACGQCGKKVIQYGIDWPWWKDGRPVCIQCRVRIANAEVNPLGRGFNDTKGGNDAT